MSNVVTAYCKVERHTQKLKAEYPYLQPFVTGEQLNEFDPVNQNVRSDMFYKPKKVVDWDSQADKWWNTWIWQFTPFPFLVFWSDLGNYVVDGLTEKPAD